MEIYVRHSQAEVNEQLKRILTDLSSRELQRWLAGWLRFYKEEFRDPEGCCYYRPRVLAVENTRPV